MAARSDLGANWSDIVQTWCLGEPIAVTDDRAWEALAAVERHYPEGLARVINSPARGRWRIARLVHIGEWLTACQGLNGFEEVARRLRTGDEGALSELAVAAHLVRAGLVPLMEPELGRNKLDLLIEFDGEPIYLEVVSPQLSQPIREAWEMLETVGAELVGELAVGEALEVLLTDESLDADRISTRVIESLKGLRAGGATVLEVSGLGLILKRAVPSTSGFRVQQARAPDREEFATLTVASFSKDPSGIKVCTVHCSVSDRRAKKFLSAESHHFSRDHRNVLVIDVSAVTGGFERWPTLIGKQLQPARNRRFGAVLFFGTINTSNAVVERWERLHNHCAEREIPEGFLAFFPADAT